MAMMVWLIFLCIQATNSCQPAEPPVFDPAIGRHAGSVYRTKAACIYGEKTMGGSHVAGEPDTLYHLDNGVVDICAVRNIDEADLVQYWSFNASDVYTEEAAHPVRPMAPADRQRLQQQMDARYAKETAEERAKIERCRKAARFNPFTLFGHLDYCGQVPPNPVRAQ
ncbi:MAG: hypothetical protein ACYDAE_17320 [Steroidobacteraceae bacterium]